MTALSKAFPCPIVLKYHGLSSTLADGPIYEGCSSTCCFLLKSSHQTSPMVFSCVDGMHNWQTKRSSVMYISSGIVLVFPMLEKASSTDRSAFFSVFQQETLLFPLRVPV